MRKSFVVATIAALFIFSGCSQKEPEVDMTKTTAPVESSGEMVETSADNGVNSVVGSEEVSDITALPEDARNAKIKALEAKAQKIYFDFDKYNIRADQQENLDADAELFKSDIAKDLTIKIEGNCDEWGTDEYNYALGLKRAKSVRDALSVKGIDKNRMVMVSYGESNPVCTEHTKECWAKNRRVEFELLP
ncbi:peptidoglycan-associated lipoprotein Pal [Hydrogenimonas thermophila]|uniref:Peptidoglycan-associated lipoprotein n=1 Tax=Hydrogenimonas thermophila TaxID=223786 RepID=A0A1I5SKC3_9BACT|nr:peptidoglycan-associated lipoprotein Pal [Hydrogenimonas thermophila]WOE70881.1 peptidoglycan-associated lipoprotein Pal [Hydrogenimonas thermophila]WOE73399.1 peptidoglycan-associated lipoprotein Pal [Hydrogenimonas thermophila]SFP70816.1 peptidoglycan-associated lipoprotein [Hydrogenimonas thermophila]